MVYKIIIVLAALIFLVGCAGIEKIKVGGGYEGIEGNVEFTFDKDQSKAFKVPAFEKLLPDGAKQIIYGFTEDQVKKINKMLAVPKDKDKKGPSIKAAKTVPAIVELLNKIKKVE